MIAAAKIQEVQAALEKFIADQELWGPDHADLMVWADGQPVAVSVAQAILALAALRTGRGLFA